MRIPLLPQGAQLHLHAEGRTQLVAGADGAIVSCGADDGNGTLAVARLGSDGSGALVAGAAGGVAYPVTALAVSHSGRLLAVGNGDDKTVHLLALPDLGHRELLTRRVTPARAIAFSPDDSLVAIASDDPTLRVVQTAAPAAEPFELRVGQPVKCLAWDPRGRYLAVYSLDGTVHVFDVADPADRALVRSVEGCKIKEDDDPALSTTEYPLAWHPSGAVLAVGSDAGALVLARDSWRPVYTLASPSAQPPSKTDKFSGTSALAWSPNGRFLAAANARRVLCAWDMTLPGVDPITHTPMVASLATRAGEPALVLHGWCRPDGDVVPEGGGEGGDGGGAGTVSTTLQLDGRPMLSSPRPTGALWTADGTGLALVDSDGHLRVVRIAKALGAASVPAVAATAGAPAFVKPGSPVEPLTQPIAWPLLVDVAPPAAAAAAAGAAATGSAAAAAAAKVLAAAAAPGKRLAALVEGTVGGGDGSGGRSKRYGEDEAMEGGDDDEDDEAGGGDGDGSARNEAAEAAKLAAALKLRGGAARGSGDGAEAVTAADVDLSLGAIKGRLGFIDGDLDGDDEGGGIQSIDPVFAPGEGSGGGGGSAALGELMRSGRLVTSERLVDHSFATGRMLRRIYGWVPPQGAFQPGATRFRGSGRDAASGDHRGQRRFLAWNQFGAVVSRSEGEAGNELDILVADKSRGGRDVHISDPIGYSMASLSESAVVLGCRYRPPSGHKDASEAAGDGKPGQIFYRSLSGWGTGAEASREWRIELPAKDRRKPWHKFPLRSPDAELGVSSSRRRQPAAAALEGGDAEDAADGDGEEGGLGGGGGAAAADAGDDVEDLDTSSAAESPLAVAMGEGWLGAVTDRHRLRIFRTGGSQEAVISVGGAPITIAAQGALCAVAYHRAAPYAHMQCISVALYVVKCAGDGAPATPGSGPRLVRCTELNLGPHATLNWLGFSQPGGMLLAHSSAGSLVALQPGLGWVWTEVCDTKAAAAVAAGGVVTEDGVRKRAGAGKDSFWPVAVVHAPASSATSVPFGAGAAAAGGVGGAAAPPFVGVGAPSRDVPVLRAVFLKGATAQPVASTSQLPLQTPIGLRLPLLDTGSSGAYDDEFLRCQLAAQARSWLGSMGLSFDSGASLALVAAMGASAAAARGEAAPATDPHALADAAVAGADAAGSRDAAELDKATIRMIKSALEGGRDVRAVQLATRLTMPRSYEVAVRLAAEGFRRGAVAERVANLHALLDVMAPGGGGSAGDEGGAWMDAGNNAPPPQLAARPRGKAPGGAGSRDAAAAGDGAADDASAASAAAEAAPPAGASFGLGGAGAGAGGGRARAAAAAPRSAAGGGSSSSSSSSSRDEQAPPAPLPHNPFARKAPAAAAQAGSPTKRKRDAFDALNQMSPQPVSRRR